MKRALAATARPVGRRRRTGAHRLALCAIVACLALVSSAGAVPAGAESTALTNGADLSGSSAPASSTSTKTIVHSANLSTTNQNMWGSGAGGPADAKLTLFNETWNESGPFGEIEEVCALEICTYYGAEFVGSVSGEIGMSIRIEGLEDGMLSVTYPVTVTFTAPADNSFDPGAAVDIKTSMVVDSANAKIVASFPQLDYVALDGVFKANASLTGQVCFIGCVPSPAGNIFPPVGINEGGEIFGFDPSGLNTCFTPAPLGLTSWFLSTYPNDRCGDVGYFNNPNVAVASTFNAADGTISATGQDKYAILPVNVLPGGGSDFFLGAISVNWTVNKAIITAIETMEQDLKFTPRVDVNLNWGKDLGFEVLNGVNDSQLQSGTSTSATFKVGDTLRLTTNSLNNKVIPITPTLSMGSATMSNNTRNASATDARIEALAFHVITYDAEGEVDSDDGFGPVYSETFPVGTTRASIFNDSFAIGGFNLPVLDTFNLVPRPIVEVRKDVVPANAPGLFNLKVDDATVAANVGDAGTTGRMVLEPGTRVISETAGTGGDLKFFDITTTCVEADGGAVHTQSAGTSPGLGSSTNLVLTGGEDLVCTVKNRLPAASECDAMVFDNVILGTPGNDTLKGTNQRDIIIGYGGDDVIEGGAADDCVSGNAGNDRIEMGAGNDVGDAGTGNDQIGAGAGNDIVYGGAGNDRLQAGAGNDSVDAGDGDDVVDGGDGVDNIFGGAGNDTLTGGSDSDRLDAGLGVDTANGSKGVAAWWAHTIPACGAHDLRGDGWR